MPNELADALTAVLSRCLTLAAEDPELRQRFQTLVRMVAREFQETLAEQRTAAPVAPPANGQLTDTLPGAVAAPLPTASPPQRPTGPPEKLPELTLGRARPAPLPSAAVSYPETVAESLQIIAERCRLKAEGTRWAAARKRKLADGANFELEIEPFDRDIISRAKSLPNCFLWMCHPTGPSPADLGLYETVAGCFEILGEAVTLIIDIQDQDESEQVDFEAALDLAAESQSALRIAINNLDGPSDTDQNAVFHWLKTIASEQQIFIRNYMRLDRPADPARWRDVHARIDEVSQRLQDTKLRRNQRRRLLGKVRHKASLIQSAPERKEAEWEGLLDTVRELVQGGLPPSNRELRDLLLPIVDLLPELENVPPEFDRVLAEIDRFLAAFPQPDSSTATKFSADVAQAEQLLRGQSLVLIGGEKRTGAYQSLKDALSLKELIWIETRAHESISGFEPYVARPDVVLVLLAIRWSSHSFGEVQSFCVKYNKPLVRLPGGYNPNQVAAQILKQASQRLA